MNNRKDKIKTKIKALLSKTTENGASEQEAVLAMAKAQQLMQQYFVSEHDLKDPFVGEKCILKSTEMFKSGYDFSIFYYPLAKLFDCETYYTNTGKIFFYGFEQDVELCIYFYGFIQKACVRSLARYQDSIDYKTERRMGVHGRTISAAFIKGFLLSVRTKMIEMYENRKSTIPEGMGLVVQEKEDKVKCSFKDLGLKLKNVSSNLDINSRGAFKTGTDEGNNLEITQGLGAYEKENTLQLN